MMPGLPGSHRTFNVMAIAGTPGVNLFANDRLITTTPNDTAYVVSMTSSMSRDQFRAYRIEDECEFAPDGSLVRFGADLVIEGTYPKIRVGRSHVDVPVDLELDATDAVTHFVRIPGVYRHWSALCHARGTVGDADVDGLATLEYAWGVGPHSIADRPLPNLRARLFTYHVLNVDDETQLLFSHVLGPLGVPVQRAVHVRTGAGARHVRRGHHFVVHEYEDRTTPDGRRMPLPRRFSWGADGVEVHGTSAGDWTYGLGAGYCGSYDYEGQHAGRAIKGHAYIEYVDCRPSPAERKR